MAAPYKYRFIKSFLPIAIACFFINTSTAQTTGKLIPKKGLILQTNSLKWTSGSEINFYTPDKRNHHYFFTWWEQDIDESAKNKDVLIIGSKNTAVSGTYSLQQRKSKIETSIQCQWNFTENSLADIVYVKIWQPYFKAAKYTNAQNQPINKLEDFKDTLLIATTPFGIFHFKNSHPFKIKFNVKESPTAKDYAVREQYLVFYEDNIGVNKATVLKRSFVIIDATERNNIKKTTTISERIAPVFQQNVWQVPAETNQLLPQPKSIQLSNEQYIIPLKSAIKNPSIDAVRQLLKQNWQIGTNYYPQIFDSVNQTLATEGYILNIDPVGINVEYATEQGKQHALQTLVQLVKNIDGKLVIPCGVIKDEPSVNWRGIHMFTGPSSWQLHRTMYSHVLLPLKMNKVVLQCEQAKWTSRPELHNAISVPMLDLKNEFAYLRKNNCEPIPLIQSLGHMEWFFKPKQNRFMAVNPQYPYTLNPDLVASQKAVRQLWNETFALLQPSTIHIGFDEIGMIGFNQPREKEVEYFKKQISILDKYAKSKNAKLMLWGDMGLGPGEGPDALNGVTKERAAIIRSFIPEGSLIGDWHYVGNADPAAYKSNLQLWKKNKNIPIASPWLWPNNVRGFVQAAIDEKAGVLQTTWADFESSEKNMLLNIEQFGAYILAMDYAWSGRKEMPENLPYDAVKEWVTRFYCQPKPIQSLHGWSIPVQPMFSNMSSSSKNENIQAINLQWKALNSTGFKIKANAATILPEGSPVAIIRFFKGNKMVYEKELRYGVELRSNNDERMLYGHTYGLSEKDYYHFFQQKFSITAVSIQQLHPAGGISMKSLVLFE